MVRNETFDEMPLAHLSATAIDFHIASELFRKRRRLKKADFHTLHAVTFPTGGAHPRGLWTLARGDT